jgi:VWFA-related protein
MKAIVTAATIALLAVPLWAQRADAPLFRSTAHSVIVDVSVKKGNNPVLGLGADDFRLLDNGVKQNVTAISMDAVPIDVSVFLDISASTYGQHAEMQRILGDVVRRLRPGDRFRVLTTGLGIRQLVGWTNAGATIDIPDPGTVADISLVYDGVYAAAAHHPAVGRRHLVVALTDGEDNCSVVRAEELGALAGRTESVVHWIPRGGTPAREDVVVARNPNTGGRGTCPYPPTKDTSPLADFALGTGGVVHGGVMESLLGGIFEHILSDYRQSYVLHYEATGVEPGGWHKIEVDVPSGKYTVRARSGYQGN